MKKIYCTSKLRLAFVKFLALALEGSDVLSTNQAVAGIRTQGEKRKHCLDPMLPANDEVENGNELRNDTGCFLTVPLVFF